LRNCRTVLEARDSTRVEHRRVEADAVAHKPMQLAAKVRDASGVDDVLDNAIAIALELVDVSLSQENFSHR
jgi:hypothetical protein